MAVGDGADEARSDAERLREDGYVVVKGALSPAVCDSIREHVLLCNKEAARLDRRDLFGNIQEQDHRCDLKLDLCPPVLEGLNELAASCGTALMEVSGGRTKIVELAAITSEGGAVAQPVHADTMHGITRFLQSDICLPGGGDPFAMAAAMSAAGPADVDSDNEEQQEDLTSIVRAVATDTALIFTSLVALQDIEQDMGPTHVWPCTNTVLAHDTLWGTHVGGKLSVADADKAFDTEHRKMTLKKGDLVLYDSRTMHCGGANSSDKIRSVLCVSVMGPGIRPDGTTWTLLRSLRNRLVLEDFPLPADRATAVAATPGAVEAALPPPPPVTEKDLAPVVEEEVEKKPLPPLKDWEAAVPCGRCRKWRPVGQLEAPKLMGGGGGFTCDMAGFSCKQEQGYSNAEIDEALG